MCVCLCLCLHAHVCMWMWEIEITDGGGKERGWVWYMLFFNNSRVVLKRTSSVMNYKFYMLFSIWPKVILKEEEERKKPQILVLLLARNLFCCLSQSDKSDLQWQIASVFITRTAPHPPTPSYSTNSFGGSYLAPHILWACVIWKKLNSILKG